MGDHEQSERLGFRAMFAQERTSDVEFDVGAEGFQTWRLTAHRRVLAASSPVMWSLFNGPLKASPHRSIRVSDVDPRAFQCLLRYMYGLAPELSTVPTALAALCAAHKYLCPGFEWECAAFLDQQMRAKPDFVLDVLLVTALYQRRQYEPTAPPAEEVESDSEGSRLVQEAVSRPRRDSRVSPTAPGTGCEHPLGEASRRLHHNCLQVIDQNADVVLSLEQLEDLDRETLLAVLGRDSLSVSCELKVLQAAERWAECECKRQKLVHGSESLRAALGGDHVVCGGHLARLLLLEPHKFVEGTGRSLLLSMDEKNSLLVHLTSSLGAPYSSCPSPPHGSPSHVAWALLATPRVCGSPQFLPLVPLRATATPHPEDNEISRRRRWGLRWPRSKRKSPAKNGQKQEKREKRPDHQSCGSKTCEYFLRVLACIFD